MTDLQYYSTEIDKILIDVLGEALRFNQSDKIVLVDLITDTILCYDKRLKRSDLAVIVQYLIQKKFVQHYSYFVPEPYEEIRANKHDYSGKRFEENVYQKRVKQIRYLKSIPQHEQKSVEWLQQRSECLTATAVAIVLDEDPYKYPADLLLDKCGRGEPFVDNANVHHGRKYEEIANMFYAHRNNVRVAEYGLIQHASHPFIGASPDGICEPDRLDGKGLSKLVGRLLEIKCPKRRQIKTEGRLNGDICPHYYYVQVQTQLFVTQMIECDFLQVKIEEYESWDEWKDDSVNDNPGLSQKTGFEKGLVISLSPKLFTSDEQRLFCSQYIYPPKLHMTLHETKKWIANSIINYPHHRYADEYVIDKIIYWRLAKVGCNLIKYEREWFESKIPMLKQFWDYVQFYNQNPKLLESLERYIKEIGSKNSRQIFQRVHKEYQKNHKCDREQLYLTPTKWRLESDATKTRYANSRYAKH